MEFAPLVSDDSQQEIDSDIDWDLDYDIEARRRSQQKAQPLSLRCMAGVTLFGALVLAAVITAAVIGVRAASNDDDVNSIASGYERETDPAYWHQVAEDELDKALQQVYQMGVAKNVILFLGDGMGMTSVTAGRILAGQAKGLKGEEFKLSFDHFPHTGLSRTYNVDKQTTDSAASGTAYVTGVKTRQGMLGVSAKAKRGDCASAKGAEVDSILKWFHNDGRSTGIVTTTAVTHASPASTYAHTPDRDWMSDQNIPEDQRACEDIASQLVTKNEHINVIMGGGRVYFKPTGYIDDRPRANYSQANDTRLDGRDLTQTWIDDKIKRGVTHSYVTTRDQLNRVDTSTNRYLLGLFNQHHMQFEVDREKDIEPSLAEMTTKAIETLQANQKGFFLMVEGGRIDQGHHISKAVKALTDVVSFSDAVEAAVRLTDIRDTLIVVTADHSHSMTISGYSARGSPILGLSMKEDGTPETDSVLDNMPYTTILYTTGPGYSTPRQNLTNIDTENKEYVSQSAVPMSETHSGEDVAIYARGPQSFLYSGVHEQNYIPMLMAYASCVGPYSDGKKKCAKTTQRVFKRDCDGRDGSP